MAKSDTNKMSAGMKTGLSLAALAAAAAGAYYFYGKDGAKHRKQLKGWMVKAKGEVMERMEGLKEVSEQTYNKVVDQVMDKYKKAKKIDAAELATLASELRGHWKRISSSIKEPAKKPSKSKASPKKQGA